MIIETAPTFTGNTVIISKNEIIAGLSTNKTLAKLAKQFLKIKNDDLYMDLLQELYLFLLSKPDKLILELHHKGQLIFYSIKFLKLQTASTRSPFINQNLKQNRNEIRMALPHIDHLPNIKEDTESGLTTLDQLKILLPQIKDIMKNEMHWYDLRILELYLREGTTMRSLSQELKIPKTSLFETLYKAAEQIKSRLNEKDKNGFTSFDHINTEE